MKIYGLNSDGFDLLQWMVFLHLLTFLFHSSDIVWYSVVLFFFFLHIFFFLLYSHSMSSGFLFFFLFVNSSAHPGSWICFFVLFSLLVGVHAGTLLISCAQQIFIQKIELRSIYTRMEFNWCDCLRMNILFFFLCSLVPNFFLCAQLLGWFSALSFDRWML